MMSCPVWVLALAVVVMVTGTGAQCWEQPRCQDLSSETNILKCIQLCRSDLTAESPVLPGDGHLQPPSPLDAEAAPPPPPPRALSPSSPSSSSSSELPAGGLLLAPPQAKRSYSMEHFRWGKPVGRKRRPVKVYTNSLENESAEDFPSEMRRANEVVEEEEEEEEQGGGADLLGSSREEEKKDGYKMNHFRWSGPPAGKRYGGFMKSWEHESSQKPLVTLFKNVIHKNAQQKRGE